jgi:hypothetical protein
MGAILFAPLDRRASSPPLSSTLPSIVVKSFEFFQREDGAMNMLEYPFRELLDATRLFYFAAEYFGNQEGITNPRFRRRDELTKARSADREEFGLG